MNTAPENVQRIRALYMRQRMNRIEKHIDKFKNDEQAKIIGRSAFINF